MQPEISPRTRAAVVAEAWFIYALVSPNSGAVRYVGFSRKPKERLRRHIAKGREESPRYPVHRWVAALIARGQVPIMQILEQGAGTSDWKEAERRLIAAHASSKLLNVSPGGQEAVVPKESRERAREKLKLRVFSDEHRRKISEAKRGVPRSDADAVRERLRAVCAANKGKKMNLSDAERARRSEMARRLRARQLGAANAEL